MGIKIGDRVKAVNSNGNTAEFTVTYITHKGGLESANNVFHLDSGWTFEKVTSPLPTEPGLYQSKGDGRGIGEAITYRYTAQYGWTDVYDNMAVRSDVENEHRLYGLYRLTREDAS